SFWVCLNSSSKYILVIRNNSKLSIMNNSDKTIIITGGAGFIGSHVVRLFINKYQSYKIVNLDALTYAGNLENLKDVENASNYIFEKVNILDTDQLVKVFSTYRPEGVIHLA